jgi:hypothetical protein
MWHDAVCRIDDSKKAMAALIEPDDQPGWALRYLWIQHRFDNDNFTKNYFTSGNNTGLNVRRQTTHLQTVWKNHNAVFDESGLNGDLVWRVKVYNNISFSIDYVEIWRSIDILKNIFIEEPKLSQGQQWTNNEKNQLGQGIFDAGFEVRHLLPYRNISKKSAIEYYWQFVDRWKNRDHCIINTRWNSELNPNET